MISQDSQSYNVLLVPNLKPAAQSVDSLVLKIKALDTINHHTLERKSSLYTILNN